MNSGAEYDHGCGQKRKPKLRVSSSVLLDRRIEFINTTLVKPHVATAPQSIPLSNLDQLFSYHYNPLILYYKNPDRKSLSEIADKLKQSLSRALVVFYPFAGRVIKSAADHLHAEIECNDAGVIFTEAFVEAHLEELRMGGGYSPAPVLSGVDAANIGPGPLFSASGSGLPPLIIQVTQFLCCGVAVAVNWLHTMADGFAGSQFVKSWAECCREHTISLQPVFDRSNLKPRSPPQIEADFIPTLQNIELWNEYPVGEPARDTDQLPFSWIQEFSPQALQKLKEEATRDGKGPFSSGDCLSAHLWKCLTRARNLSPEEITTFVVYIEGRQKMIPPLPEGFLGNVVCIQCASATVKDLLSQPLSFGADLIRKAIQRTTHQTYRSLMDWVQQKPASANAYLGGSQMSFGGSNLAVSSWGRFPLYEMDFGWQKPEFGVRNGGSVNFGNGVWFFLPSPAGKFTTKLFFSIFKNTYWLLFWKIQSYVRCKNFPKTASKVG